MLRALILIPLFLTAACTSDRMPVEIPFRAVFGDRPIDCATPRPEFVLTDLRFYVHDVRLIDERGRETPLELVVVPGWQNGEVSLLDLENAEGSCANGTSGTHAVMQGRVAAGVYRGLKFRIGVPEHLNHGDVLQAEPPLTDTAMHWHWVSGYRFLRAGIASDTDGFWLHLGSTRCSGTVTHIKGCASSNRAEAELQGFVPGRDTVMVDLQRLVDGVDLEDGVPTDCSSEPSELTCAKPFSTLGVDFGSGSVRAPAAIFRHEATP
jgi:uncharacterized repeat protein (TIGR04052 family)